MSFEINMIDQSGWIGLRISTLEGDLYRTIAVGKNEDGRIVAAQSFDNVDDVSLLTSYEIDDVSTNQGWIWALLSGKVDHSVTSALGRVDLYDTEFSEGDFSKFTSEIDLEAVQLLSSSAEPRLSHLVFYSGDDDRALNRKRHGAIYPIFSDVMAAKLQTKRVIDTKSGSLPDAMCRVLSSSTFEVTPAYLKRFAKMSAFPEGCDRGAVLSFSAQVPPDWFPVTDEEWEAYCQIATAVFGELSPSPDQHKALIKSASGKWSQLRTKILNAAFPPTHEELNENRRLAAPDGHVPTPLKQSSTDLLDNLRSSMKSVSDMIGAFSTNVVFPMIAFNQASQNVYINNELRLAAFGVAYKLLLDNRGIVDVADLARRFHQEQHALLEGDEILQQERKRFIAYQIDGDWPGLTDRRQSPNGLWLVPLTSLSQLRDESNQLNHCVGRGGYDAAAERCDTHIISVKQEMPGVGLRSVSTVEISGIRALSGPFEVVQHRSTGNGTPSQEAQVALSWYLDSLKAGKIETNWEKIKAFKQVDARDIDAVERGCHYDWRDPQYIFSATVPWYPFLVKAYRNFSFEEMIGLEDIVRVSDMVAPDVLRMPSATS